MLLGIEEEGQSRTVSLPEEPVVLGRGETAGIVLAEKRASREHLLITPVPGGAIVRDLGSTNGTCVGGQRVLLSRLLPGDAVRIGDATVTLLAEEPPASEPARRPGGLLLPLFGPALLLVILAQVAVHAVASSRLKVITAAEDRIADAEFLIAKSEPDPRKSLEALTAFVEAHPAAARAEEAAGLVVRLRQEVSHLAEAQREIELLRANAGLPATEREYGYRRLLEAYADVPEAAREARAALEELGRARREEQAAQFAEARRAADDLLSRGQFGPAFSALSSFSLTAPSAASAHRDDLRQMETDVLRRAEEDYRSLLERADALSREGRRDEGAALLRDEAPRFTGLRFSPLLRARADTISAAPRSTGARAPDTVSETAARRSLYLLAQQAEELAAARRFAQAAAKYAEILPSVGVPEVREEFTRRAEELTRLDGLLIAVRSQVVEKGRQFGPVEFPGGRFLVVGSEGDDLLLEYSGQRVGRPWASLTPPEMLEVLRAAKFPPEERLGVALYAAETGQQEEFAAEIVAMLEREPLREAAGRLWAAKRGEPYPEGGYLAHKGRILDRRGYAEEVHRERVTAIRDRQVKALARIRDHAAFRRLAKLRDLRGDLDKAREFALALIFDEVKYFYPYQDRRAEYEIVQREVDARTAAVKAIWDTTLNVTVKADDSLAGLVAEAKRTIEELQELGADASEFERALAEATLHLGRTLTVRDFFVDAAERDLLDYDAKVMEWNRTAETSAGEMERRQVEITNEYRRMMGRRVLALEEKLVRTARGHCEEMSKEGYFSHFSPHPERRTPDLRAKIEGYVGSAVSENIHRGSGDPQSAHLGWLHSSGHHRNILQKFWTEMGTGQSGPYWTQNFGRTKMKEFPAR